MDIINNELIGIGKTRQSVHVIINEVEMMCITRLIVLNLPLLETI